MITTPEIITFCSTKAELDMAVSLGVDHVILDHPLLSLCSFIPPKATDSIHSLDELITYTKTQYPAITISVQCDILAHQKDLALMDTLAKIIQANPVDFIRVQDLGLLHFFSDKVAVIYYAQMGNSSHVSIEQLKHIASRQTLSMDIPYTDICTIQEKTKTPLEIVVHGHCLIQYSQRRFLTGLAEESADHLNQIHVFAEDDDYPGRRFTFLDNPHGHFMFAYFDRCLLNDYDELSACKLTGWIIDTRGQDKDYQKACIQAYAMLKNNVSETVFEPVLTTVKTLAPRPLKPGFFRMNQTDKRRFKKVAHQAHESADIIGQVVDVITKKRITILLKQSFKKGECFAVIHPKVGQLQIEVTQCWDSDNNQCDGGEEGDLIQLSWVKGIQQHALLKRIPKDISSE
jgi:collagenase-like PrtC family protease